MRDVLRDRGRYVSAALTIVRAWIVAGRPQTAWQSAFGKTAAMVRDAVKRASEFQDAHVDLREVLHDIADERGEINRRKLGWWIRRHAGRIVNGRRFIRASGNRSAEAWQVESVSSVSPVSSSPSTKSVSGASDDAEPMFAPVAANDRRGRADP